MRKKLLSVGLLALGFAAQAQTPTLHVDNSALMYVSKDALVFNGGSMQTKNTGKVENHGDFMVSGATSDFFKTIDGANVDKTEAAGGANFVNMLNEPANFKTRNSTEVVIPPVYTYGQLYIKGIAQDNLKGIVDQEVRMEKSGDYQQMGLPFYNKSFSTLAAELGKTFGVVRYSKNELLQYDNATVEPKTITDLSKKIGVDYPYHSYYMVGGAGLDTETVTRTLKGRPLTDQGVNLQLQNAGLGINFGTNGYGLNSYNEFYNSYLNDPYHMGAGGTAWSGNFGKNIYQFSNPFFTNLDLSQIAFNDASGDGVNLSSIYAVRTMPTNVKHTPNVGSAYTSSTYKSITFSAGVATGDVEYVMIRPLETFVIKLADNTGANKLFDFDKLRRFKYQPRASNVAYDINAARSASTGTVKQLGVIALNAAGKEIGRTYYVVYPNGTTGHSATSDTQITGFSTDIMNTYEEAPTGGYDLNYTNSYWLYINEANEANFQGKAIKLVKYDSNLIPADKVASYKFEIRENAKLVANGTHALSSGIGFYYKAANGTVMPAIQNGTTVPTHDEYDLYYGTPSNEVLATTNTAKPSRTVVVYNPQISNYIVRFDPSWRKANIQVFDMSGKLVISKNDVNTSADFTLELDSSIKNSYVVKIVADNGEVVNTKILK